MVTKASPNQVKRPTNPTRIHRSRGTVNSCHGRRFLLPDHEPRPHFPGGASTSTPAEREHIEVNLGQKMKEDRVAAQKRLCASDPRAPRVAHEEPSEGAMLPKRVDFVDPRPLMLAMRRMSVGRLPAFPSLKPR